MVCGFSCLVVVWYKSVLTISFKITSLTLRLSYNYSSATGANLKISINISLNYTINSWHNHIKSIKTQLYSFIMGYIVTVHAVVLSIFVSQSHSLSAINYCLPYIEGILQKGPYLPCVSMAGRALLAGYPRYSVILSHTKAFNINGHEMMLSCTLLEIMATHHKLMMTMQHKTPGHALLVLGNPWHQRL